PRPVRARWDRPHRQQRAPSPTLQATQTAAPTRFRAPQPPPPAPLRNLCHRPTGIAARPATLPVSFQVTRPPADPATAQLPVHAATESARSIAQPAYRIRIPHQKTATHVP